MNSHNKKKKIFILSTLLLLFYSGTLPQILNGANINQVDNSELINLQERRPLEANNFIPEGGDSFQTANGWTYPTSSQYQDTYWGDGNAVPGSSNENSTHTKTVTQNWNPVNEEFSDVAITVAGSEDFDTTGPVGSFQLNSAARSRAFGMYGLDVLSSFSSSSISYNDNYLTEWGTGNNQNQVFTNPEDSTTVGPYTPGNEDPSLMLATGTTPSLKYDTNEKIYYYETNLQRPWWYNLDYAGGDRVSGARTTWDINSTYSSQYYLHFFYNGTRENTIASYNADIIISDIDNSGPYTFDYTVKITYDIYKETNNQNIFQVTQTQTHFSASSFSAPEVDFSEYLDDSEGWYYLKINVEVEMELTGDAEFYSANNQPLTGTKDWGYCSINVQMRNVNINIEEQSTPLKFEENQEILMESDWIPWGDETNIPQSELATMSFGYQISDDINGYPNPTSTLENIRAVAYLTIQNSTETNTYRFTDIKDFSQIKNSDINSVGENCSKFSWEMNNTVRMNLNGSLQIKWKIGIVIESGLHIVDTNYFSRIYFNNIDFTVVTTSKVTGTFVIRNPDGAIISDVNVSMSNGEETYWVYTGSSSGTASFSSLSAGTWRILVNKTVNDNDVYIYNSTYTIPAEVTSFTENIYCNLTNIIFYPLNEEGNPITSYNTIENYISIQSVSNPSDYRISKIDEKGSAFFGEIYNGDWEVVVNVTENGESYTIGRYIRTIDTSSLPGAELFFITSPSIVELEKDLTNILFNLKEPGLFTNVEGALVKFTDQNVPSSIFQGYTNSDGNVTLREIYKSTWNIEVSIDGNIVLDTEYLLDTTANVSYRNYIYILTTVELKVLDYSGGNLGGTNPIVIIENTDGTTYQKSLVNGNATIDYLYNETMSNSWFLTVKVTYEGIQTTVYDSYFELDTNQPIIYRTIQANLTTFEMELIDLDGSPIVGANVNLTDKDSDLSIFRTSNTNGMLTFPKVYDTTWNVEINYTVKSSTAILSKVMEIYNNDAYDEINLSGQAYITRANPIICNLTTLEIYVEDFDTGSPINRANVTLRHMDGEIISTYRSNLDGYIKMILPADSYNFSVTYDGLKRDFIFNDTADVWADKFENKTYTISSKIAVKMLIDISETLTSFGLEDIYFYKTEWDSSRPELDTERDPIRAFMYYGDSAELSFIYKDIETGDTPAIDGDTLTWTLRNPTGTIVNSSLEIAEMATGDTGIYNLSIFTVDYQSIGIYSLDVTITKENYQTGLFEIEIEFLNFTTNLARITPTQELTVVWGDDINIAVNYTINTPYFSDKNITGATVKYSSDFGMEGEMNRFEDWGTAGIYILSFSSYELDVGSYILFITAYKENMEPKTIQVLFTINSVPTTYTEIIDECFEVSTRYVKTARNENFTILFNYQYNLPGNSTDIESPTITAYLNSPANPITIYPSSEGGWNWIISRNSTSYSLGTHNLYITMQKANHQTLTVEFTIEIIDAWGTTLTVIEPAEFTPWSNNFSYTVKYEVNEHPRSNLVILDEANLDNIRITTIIDSVETTILTLDTFNTELWSWTNLGDGNYIIEINSSIIEVTGTKLFYIVPTFTNRLYKDGTTKPYVWITTLKTSSTLSLKGQEIVKLEVYQGNQPTVEVDLFVSEVESGLFEKPVIGATLTYQMRNKTSGELVASGSLTAHSSIPGRYNLTRFYGVRGVYVIEVFMNHLNHSFLTRVLFDVEVIAVPPDYKTTIPNDIRISSNSIKVAHGENIYLDIEFLETLLEVPQLYMLINGENYPITHDFGRYFFFELSAEELEPGQYTMVLDSTEPDFIVPTDFELEIINSWSTITEIIVPPKSYPWNNISSFIIKYYSNEAPRNNRLLSDATIYSMDIKYERAGFLRTYTTLVPENLTEGIWNWVNLKDIPGYGPGYFYIEFNTSIFTISEQELFYLIPNIGYETYQNATPNPYMLVNPILTNLIPLTKELGALGDISIFLDEKIEFRTHFLIRDQLSVLFGDNIEDASIYYDIFDNEENIVKSGILKKEGNGIYSLSHSSSIFDIGDYIINVYAFKPNHEVSEIFIDLEIKSKLINIMEGGLKTGDIISTPQNLDKLIHITLWDPVKNQPLTGASIKVLINDIEIEKTIEETTPGSGNYSVLFLKSELAKYDRGTHKLDFVIQKANHTDFIITTSLVIEYPVDPTFNLPWYYWYLIMGIVGIVATVLLGNKYYQNSKIAPFIRMIDKNIKTINKEGDLSDSDNKFADSYEEIFIKKYGSYWQKLDLSINKSLGIKEEIVISEDENLTPNDMKKEDD